jgi:hypothetical protein
VSIQEYAAAIRDRYLRASRSQKHAILTEFCETTGYHRKSAIRLLRNPPKRSGKRRGRRPDYGPEVARALKVAWEATDRVCSKRLAPFLPELIPVLERHDELKLSAEVRSKLLQISPATIDRLLARARREDVRHPRTSARSSSALKAMIPIRTFGDWKDATVGFLEADLVAHCGQSAQGFYLCTLVAVDIVTSWTVCVPVWGKNQSRVGSATDRLRRQLPFPMLGIDTDNGGEFINQGLWDYCQRHHIKFTRSRSYKKNDQAHVEQRNWTSVRRRVGYDRFSTKAAYALLERLYQLTNLHTNFFQPTSKLVSKQRVGAKVHKKYDTAQTPYQRLLKTGVMDKAHQQVMAAHFRSLNPVELCRQIDETLEALWKLAERDHPREVLETEDEDGSEIPEVEQPHPRT